MRKIFSNAVEMPLNTSANYMDRKRAVKSHLLIETITQLGDAALDLVELAALLSSVSLDNVHDFNSSIWICRLCLLSQVDDGKK